MSIIKDENEENLRQEGSAILHKRTIWISSKTSLTIQSFAYNFGESVLKSIYLVARFHPNPWLVIYIYPQPNLGNNFLHTPQNLSFIISICLPNDIFNFSFSFIIDSLIQYKTCIGGSLKHLYFVLIFC